MWIIKKSSADQELINKAIAKVMQKTNEKCSEGLAVETALKEFIKRG